MAAPTNPYSATNILVRNRHRNNHVAKKSFSTGDQVEVFYRMPEQDAYNGYFPVQNNAAGLYGPRYGKTEGWQQAVVIADFNHKSFDAKNKDTWVLVRYTHLDWFNRRGVKLNTADVRNLEEEVLPCNVRATTDTDPNVVCVQKPTISFLVVRWGGKIECQPYNDPGPGSWGHTGSVVSDTFIGSFFNMVYYHLGPNFEVLSVFIQSSQDLASFSTGLVAPQLIGRHLCGMYFLYPVMFQDVSEVYEEHPGYVQEQPLFHFMQQAEAAGIPTRFPHPSHLYRLLASKNWCAHMCLSVDKSVPVTTKVNRGAIARNPLKAAETALRAMFMLHQEKKRLAQGAGGQEAIELDVPQYIEPTAHQLEIMEGVVKMGFSWEAVDVRAFKGPAQLAHACKSLTEQAGCYTEHVIVQERIHANCEFRMYVINGVPCKIIYTKFSTTNHEGRFESFQRFEREPVVKQWFRGSYKAVTQAELRIRDQTNRWLAWLRTECPELPPVVRFDYFVRQVGDDCVVTIGEITECGASTLGWRDGPDMVLKAVLMSAFTDHACGSEPCLCSADQQRDYLSQVHAKNCFARPAAPDPAPQSRRPNGKSETKGEKGTPAHKHRKGQ
ncbi:hypothetical protein CYMTET_32377 [Cymbomonas tetramitiformis]|uniref:Uncharacterized protein n=1 Tax=Cymbomonas tetramitiformis TaxID=36881 RepID=A0AAE0FF05_9CHLO|nr:hypothetical protein CYMTET_32377 [Cymbomonas tetramitiformis]